MLHPPKKKKKISFAGMNAMQRADGARGQTWVRQSRLRRGWRGKMRAAAAGLSDCHREPAAPRNPRDRAALARPGMLVVEGRRLTNGARFSQHPCKIRSRKAKPPRQRFPDFPGFAARGVFSPLHSSSRPKGLSKSLVC